MSKHQTPRCLQCKHRAWRTLAGFLVLGCVMHRLRFGILPDLLRGYVNQKGDCVPMPRHCGDYA